MDVKTNLKAKLSSWHVTEGPGRAPQAIGLALPCSAGAPAPCEIRDAFCMTAGEKVVELVEAGLRPRDNVTRKAFENAAAVVAASGGSTKEALHLPAFTHECGRKFDLSDVAEVFKKTPYIADLKPGGRYVAKDMFEGRGVPLLMKTLLDRGFLHGECITVTGRNVAENLKRVKWNGALDVVLPAGKPLSKTGAVVGLKGNLAPEDAIVKVAGMSDLNFTGPARSFGGEEACFEAVTKNVTKKKYAARAKTGKARTSRSTSGYLWKYARQVGAAREGAVMHPGGAAEKSCYADI